MKKLIIAILLAVVLVAGGLGGFVYAQNNSHEPMTGQKLVGLGMSAEWEAGGILNFSDAYIFLTNPDGVSEITIDRHIRIHL